MKNLILLVILFYEIVYAGTCTSISRSNYTTNQVLTSSSLNTQLNAVFGAANALDGGCITDNTTEAAALNTTEFATPLRAIQQGCQLTYSSANVVSISKCYTSVNGAWVSKSTSTTVTQGCTSCASDTASTTMYIYIASGSTGSTLTGLILTGAPNADGYDASGNKCVGRIYNNASAAFDQYSIDQWVVDKFVPDNVGWTSYTPTGSWTSNVTYAGKFRRIGENMDIEVEIATSGAPTSAALTFLIPIDYTINTSKMVDSSFATPLGNAMMNDLVANDVFTGLSQFASTNGISVKTHQTSGTYAIMTAVTQAVPFTFGTGDAVIVRATFPITGWNN